VTLVLAARTGRPADRDQFSGIVAHALQGDLPAADHEAARRVLSTVLERAQAELRAGV
jgi:hypothetical protein